MKTEEEEEHEGAAHGHGVHTYFEVDVAEPACADSQEGAKEKMDRDDRDGGIIGHPHKNEPGPEVKDHGRDIGDEPFPLGPEHHGANEPEPPHEEDCKSG